MTVAAAIVALGVLLVLVVVLAVLRQLKPTKLRLSLKLTSWCHLELESESHVRGLPTGKKQE